MLPTRVLLHGKAQVDCRVRDGHEEDGKEAEKGAKDRGLLEPTPARSRAQARDGEEQSRACDHDGGGDVREHHAEHRPPPGLLQPYALEGKDAQIQDSAGEGEEVLDGRGEAHRRLGEDQGRLKEADGAGGASGDNASDQLFREPVPRPDVCATAGRGHAQPHRRGHHQHHEEDRPSRHRAAGLAVGARLPVEPPHGRALAASDPSRAEYAHLVHRVSQQGAGAQDAAAGAEEHDIPNGHAPLRHEGAAVLQHARALGEHRRGVALRPHALHAGRAGHAEVWQKVPRGRIERTSAALTLVVESLAADALRDAPGAGVGGGHPPRSRAGLARAPARGHGVAATLAPCTGIHAHVASKQAHAARLAGGHADLLCERSGSAGLAERGVGAAGAVVDGAQGAFHRKHGALQAEGAHRALQRRARSGGGAVEPHVTELTRTSLRRCPACFTWFACHAALPPCQTWGAVLALHQPRLPVFRVQPGGIPIPPNPLARDVEIRPVEGPEPICEAPVLQLLDHGLDVRLLDAELFKHRNGLRDGLLQLPPYHLVRGELGYPQAWPIHDFARINNVAVPFGDPGVSEHYGQKGVRRPPVEEVAVCSVLAPVFGQNRLVLGSPGASVNDRDVELLPCLDSVGAPRVARVVVEVGNALVQRSSSLLARGRYPIAVLDASPAKGGAARALGWYGAPVEGNWPHRVGAVPVPPRRSPAVDDALPPGLGV
mmetsp:Transcript_47791/g.147341  ORF Transcript_47791/g.147341 Transcript_47791/m.147341 type:complete len:715 (-) Transcript_47791:827-2971(-)